MNQRVLSSIGLSPLLLLSAVLAGGVVSCAHPDAAANLAPAAGSKAQADRNAAGWAEQEAERRMTDGDYEGAIQANQQAEQDRQAATGRR